MSSGKISAIITGATGMVGEGVLHECLNDPAVEKVLIINRKPSGFIHPKLSEIVHQDFFDLSTVQSKLRGYDACFFCLGVSSVGMKEPEYYRLTYTLTMNFANALTESKSMTFCYVSGSGTDRTEKGKLMWARVKGKTENALAEFPFKKFFAFRPGYMHPTPGLKNVLSAYKYLGWLFPIFKLVIPKKVNTLAELGKSMIRVARFGYEKDIIDPPDISVLARKETI